MRRGYTLFLAILIIVGVAFAYMMQNTRGPMPGAALQDGDSCETTAPGGG